MTVLNEDRLLEALNRVMEEMVERIARWLSECSGWIIEEIMNHYINVVSYIPLRGSSYIPLPSKLSNSKKGL